MGVCGQVVKVLELVEVARCFIRLEHVDGRREKYFSRQNGDCVEKCLEVDAFWVVTLCRYIWSFNYYLFIENSKWTVDFYGADFIVLWFCVYINNYSSSILALCTLHFYPHETRCCGGDRARWGCCCIFYGQNWEGEILNHQTCRNNRVDLFLRYHTSLYFLWKLVYTWSCCTSWQHIPLIR